MGLIVLPYFAPKCLDPYEWGRVLDSDGFLSQLSVELFGIYPEGLIIIIIIITVVIIIIVIINIIIIIIIIIVIIIIIIIIFRCIYNQPISLHMD